MAYNFGAKQYKRVKETYYIMIRFALIVGLIETFCFWVFPNQILNIFGDGVEGYGEFALLYMHVYMFLVVLSGVTPPTMNALSSIKQPKKGIVISLSKQLTLITLLLVLPRLRGIYGVLYAGPIADFLACAISLTVIGREFKKLEMSVQN